MPFDIEVAGKDELIQRLSERRTRLPAALQQTMKEQMGRVAGKVTRKLSNDVLHIRTGNLVNSVFFDANSTDSEVTGVVGTGAQAPYAVYHEEGRSYDRVVSVAWGRPMKNPHTVHFDLPARSFLKPSLDDSRDSILAELRGSVVEVLQS